jgi:hypothetical protein
MELADAPTGRIDYAESVVKILERSDNNIVGEGPFFLRGGILVCMGMRRPIGPKGDRRPLRITIAIADLNAVALANMSAILWLMQPISVISK